MSFLSIEKAARNKGVNDNTVRLITSMLFNRNVEMDLAGKKLRTAITMGCPQGGVLSSIWWNLVPDSPILKLNRLGYYSIRYEDDLDNLLRGKFCDYSFRVNDGSSENCGGLVYKRGPSDQR